MTFRDTVASAISAATHRPFSIRSASPVGGGSINEALRIEGTDGTRYFLKLNDARHHAMFVAEAAGLDAIAATDTLRVPHVIAHGVAGKQSFLVLEHLELSARGDAKLLGEQLATLHRNTSSRFGSLKTTSSAPQSSRMDGKRTGSISGANNVWASNYNSQ